MEIIKRIRKEKWHQQELEKVLGVKTDFRILIIERAWEIGYEEV